MPLKVKRLARDPERFMWAVSMAQTRHINFRIRVGSLVQNANMFAPYAGKFLPYIFPFYLIISYLPFFPMGQAYRLQFRPT